MAQRKDPKSTKSKKQKSTAPRSQKFAAGASEETLDETHEESQETEAWAQEAEAAGEQEAITYNHDESHSMDEEADGHAQGQSSNNHNNSSENSNGSANSHASSFSSEDQEEEPVRVDFPYSDMLRAYAPDVMKVADKVATDWQKEGNFMNLGIENPYANMAVSMGLQKAKEVEKKLEEKGVLSAVRMGFEVLKQQVNKRR